MTGPGRRPDQISSSVEKGLSYFAHKQVTPRATPTSLTRIILQYVIVCEAYSTNSGRIIVIQLLI